ncbi:MAG TPA: hypothetical protein VF597_01270 [Candidatus Saccharimonadales bacterium]|jgi:hypothetical protein
MNDQAKDVTYDYDPYRFDLPLLLKLLVTGLLSGLIGWILYELLARYVVAPLLCGNVDSFALCQNGGTVAWGTAHVLVLVASVAVLAKLAVYRPLLIVLAVLVALWGTHQWLGVMPWYIAAAWQTLLFLLAFGLFGWVARTTNFIVALVLSLVLAIGARLILTYL